MSGARTERDYYAILEVAPGARPNVIDAAWRQMVKDYHPDLHPGDPATEGRIKLINEAHDVLSDPGERASYDRRRNEARRSPRPEASGGPAPRPAGSAPGARSKASSKGAARARSIPWTPVRRWVQRTLRWRVLPWLVQTRLGQWVVVVAVGATATYAADSVPALGWSPVTAFAGAFVLSSLLIALWARSFWGSPLGDVVSVVFDLLRGFF
jgi:hypothetical protein